MTCSKNSVSFGICLLWIATFVLAAPPAAGYHLLKRISLGQAEGGGEYFDYITVDAAARRAYLSHGTEIEVVDADSGVEVGKIGGLKRDHGVALVPELGRGFISDGDAAQIVIFDLKTLKMVSEWVLINFASLNGADLVVELGSRTDTMVWLGWLSRFRGGDWNG